MFKSMINYVKTVDFCEKSIFRCMLVNMISYLLESLEPPCCKKWQKSPCQDTGLVNRGPLQALNDAKLILND